MAILYDDNFGHYESEPGDEEETMRFYKQVQSESIWKECRVCHRRVKLHKSYDMCNSCADRLERMGGY